MAQTDKGGGQVGHHGLRQHRLNFIVELVRILNQPRVGGDELVVRNIAEPMDPFKPGPPPGQIELICSPEPPAGAPSTPGLSSSSPRDRQFVGGGRCSGTRPQ